MNITKKLAEEASKQAAAKIYEKEILVLHQTLTTAYEQHFKKYVPAPVLGVCDEYGSWFSTSRLPYIYVNGRSFYETISFPIPAYFRSVSNLGNNDDIENIKSLALLLVVTESKRDALADTVYNEIMRLKTKKRITEEFPEVLRYIEWPAEQVKNPPASKLDELRKILSKNDKK